MNKHTRFLNAMDGKTVDRVPVTFFTHSLVQNTTTDNAVEDQLGWFHDGNMDGLCIETDGYMEYPQNFPLKSLDDWKHIRVHQKSEHYIAGQLDRAKRIVDGIGDGAVFFMIYTPFSTIKHTIGGEHLIKQYYRQNPQIINDAMKVIEEDTFQLMDYLMSETGIDGFFVSFQNAEKWRFSAEEYMEALAPWDRRLLAHANSLSDYNITHLCSWTGNPNQLDCWKDYDYKTVNWAVTIEENMNFRQGREYFRKGSTLMGGFCSTMTGTLYTGTREEIRDLTFRQLDLAGQTGTILCGDCSAVVDTPRENIRYVVEAAEEYAVLHR